MVQPLTHFATTRWSLIRAEQASHGRPAGNNALAELCQIYWRPIFTFVCRKGYSVADAQDLTQDFFIEVLEGKLIQLADPGRGRFRSLVLKSLTNFLIDRKVKSRRRKRGGTIQFIPWNDWMDEASAHEMLSTNALAQASDETLFDFRSDLSPAFVKVVETATNPDPGSRYTSAGQMLAALSEVAGGSAISFSAPR